MNNEQSKALAWVRETFPRWNALTHPLKTIGELLCRQTGALLHRWRGWETFESGLRQHLSELPARQLNSVVKWACAQPLNALAEV